MSDTRAEKATKQKQVSSLKLPRIVPATPRVGVNRFMFGKLGKVEIMVYE